MHCYFLLQILLITSYSLHLHQFYALETASILQNSDSIKILNDCKSQCLTMKDEFPFSFKYHRYILRQTTGQIKYIQGQCLFTAGQLYEDNQYHSWSDLKFFIADTQSEVSINQLTIWQNYSVDCQSDKLKLSNDEIQSLNLTRVHSNFDYYDNGTFVNLQPFDLQAMMNSLQNLGLHHQSQSKA